MYAILSLALTLAYSRRYGTVVLYFGTRIFRDCLHGDLQLVLSNHEELVHLQAKSHCKAWQRLRCKEYPKRAAALASEVSSVHVR